VFNSTDISSGSVSTFLSVPSSVLLLSSVDDDTIRRHKMTITHGKLRILRPQTVMSFHIYSYLFLDSNWKCPAKSNLYVLGIIKEKTSALPKTNYFMINMKYADYVLFFNSVLRKRSKEWLVRNQENVSSKSVMSTRGLMFQ